MNATAFISSLAQLRAAERGILVGSRVRIREGCSCAGAVFTVTEIVGAVGVTNPECVQVFGDMGLGPVRLTELEAVR